MNVAANLIEPPPNPIVTLLEKALDDARSGKLAQAVLIGITPGGQIGFSWSGQPASLLLAVELFKKQQLESLQQPASPILRPAMAS